MAKVRAGLKVRWRYRMHNEVGLWPDWLKLMEGLACEGWGLVDSARRRKAREGCSVYPIVEYEGFEAH